MTIDKKNRDEKLQSNINREAVEISALSPGKIDKYEYLTGQEMLPYSPSQIIQHAKFTYSLLGKELKKQTKLIESQKKLC